MVDIPKGWDPQAKQQPARLIAYSADCVVRAALFKSCLSLEIQKRHPKGCLFFVWASQDLNPGPSGYENVANFEIPFFLWNLVTIS